MSNLPTDSHSPDTPADNQAALTPTDSYSSSSVDGKLSCELAWQMLDEQLDEEGQEQLGLLLTHSGDARKGYVEAVFLHVDLLSHFGNLPNVGNLPTN